MVAATHIVLGTVQWGKPYGIANTSGQPNKAQVREILSLAEAHGITQLDTACDYGEAESVIGELACDRWRVVTKLTLQLDTDDIAAAKASVEQSLQLLRRERLASFLVQCPEQRRLPNVWSYLKDLRQSQTFARLGISASTPQEAMAALEDEDVEHIQVASSILDQRLVRQGFFESAKARGKTVHIRSVFLQGVAFLDPGDLPAGLKGLANELQMIEDFAAATHMSRQAVFLQYACNLPSAGVVIGCETVGQLEQNLSMLAQQGVGADLDRLANSIVLHEDRVLDPDFWH